MDQGEGTVRLEVRVKFLHCENRDVQIAVLVFVKFVEFVATENRHEFHELTLIPLGGYKVHKTVKFCIMAGTAMPRSHRGTGAAPVKDWAISLTRYRLLVRTKFTKWSNFVREAWLIKEK